MSPIEIERAFYAGGWVEITEKGTQAWRLCKKPTWNWGDFDYRLINENDLA